MGACVPPAVVSTLSALVERGLPAAFAVIGQTQGGKPCAKKVRFPGLRFPPIEATTSTPPQDVVPWGSGASRPWMACARSLEPRMAEPGDAPGPQGAAAPSEADAPTLRVGAGSHWQGTAAPSGASASRAPPKTPLRCPRPTWRPAPSQRRQLLLRPLPAIGRSACPCARTALRAGTSQRVSCEPIPRPHDRRPPSGRRRCRPQQDIPWR